MARIEIVCNFSIPSSCFCLYGRKTLWPLAQSSAFSAQAKRFFVAGYFRLHQHTKTFFGTDKKEHQDVQLTKPTWEFYRIIVLKTTLFARFVSRSSPWNRMLHDKLQEKRTLIFIKEIDWLKSHAYFPITFFWKKITNLNWLWFNWKVCVFFFFSYLWPIFPQARRAVSLKKSCPIRRVPDVGETKFLPPSDGVRVPNVHTRQHIQQHLKIHERQCAACIFASQENEDI